MNSLCKFINAISAMIASLAFAWLAFTITGTIPNHAAKVTVYHRGGFDMTHSGSLDMTHDGSVEITH
jgi:hypothetical protein